MPQLSAGGIALKASTIALVISLSVCGNLPPFTAFSTSSDVASAYCNTCASDVSDA